MSTRHVRPLDISAPYAAAGDQPAAIDALSAAIERDERDVVLAGVTGSGKSFTLASTLARVNRPAVVLAPNKTLAAQLYSELSGFFPQAAVEYFVSYYDYYRPEAYVTASDTFVEKESARNSDLDRLRHSATGAALTRSDTVAVCSVSAVYGLGDPASYAQSLVSVARGDRIEPSSLAAALVSIGYVRNDIELERGRFRMRGDTLTVHPAHAPSPLRIEFFEDAIERLTVVHPATGQALEHRDAEVIFPATHYAAPHTGPAMEEVCQAIATELDARVAQLQAAGDLVAAQRLAERTAQDLEMLRETGSCAGIENYSRHLEGRGPGERPFTFFDYMPDGLVVIVDESHVTVPQLMAAYGGDRSRKENLVAHGFRLPSALDNRPLTFDELDALWSAKSATVIYVSATPGQFETERATTHVPLELRPTGLCDPRCEVRPRQGAVDDLLAEITATTDAGWRTLVTTLTKSSAEALCEHLRGARVKVRYLHSDIDTLERVEILDDLRAGEFDVLVGINLLREGLDLPEVALVAVLDADVQGFLRSRTALVQTFGRAARNAQGRVVCYADTLTPALSSALEETAARRARQEAHNAALGIVPTTAIRQASRLAGSRPAKTGAAPPSSSVDALGADAQSGDAAPVDPLTHRRLLEEAMAQAAADLRFEDAARFRDELRALGSLGDPRPATP